MPDAITFSRLHLPRPIDAVTLQQLIGRVMSGDVPRPFVLEVHATGDGVTHLMGCPKLATRRLQRLLTGLLPGLGFDAAKRADVATVARVVAHPGSLPLAEADPEQIVAAIYQALSARRGDEHIAMQLIIGRAHAPRRLPEDAADPLQSLGSVMLSGVRPASGSTRTQLVQRTAEPTLSVTLRIGVTAESKKRQSALTWELFGALQLMESAGVHLTLSRDTAYRFKTATQGRGLRVSARELVPLIAWPLGEHDYPGIAGAHPRLLPVPEVVSRTESVFATGTAPGPERPVGIDPLSRLQHMVVLGPTGSGKSTLLEHLILSDIEAGRACAVIEPKSQLIERILATAPKDAADRIVLLDATDSEAPVGFNPLDVGDRDPDIVVDGILAALAAVFSDSWGPRTEYLIQGALLSLARAGQKRAEPYTLIDLPRVFTDDAFRRPIMAAVRDDLTLKAFWEEFEAMRPAQRATIIASPLNKLRKIVMRKPLVAVLGQSQPRFRLRDIFQNRSVVLVPLNDALLGTGASRLLGSLIVSELWMATLERAREKEPMKRPGMVFIDEVQNYLHLPTPIDDVLATSRSYGVAWHLAHQYRDQLPAKLRSALDVNARSKICFALDADDARDLAKQAPTLTAADFQALGKHHIYTRLVAGGSPVAWCSALASPPLKTTGHAEHIRTASRKRWGAEPPTIEPLVDAAPAASAGVGHQKARRS